MAIKFSARAEGVEVLSRELKNLEADLQDQTPTLGEVARRDYYPIMREQFETGGRGRWKPLDARYARRKRARYGDSPILQASGALARSFAVRGVPSNVHLFVGKSDLVLGSVRSYAAKQNQDRTIQDFTEADFDRMTETFVDASRERVAKRGFEVE